MVATHGMSSPTSLTVEQARQCDIARCVHRIHRRYDARPERAARGSIASPPTSAASASSYAILSSDLGKGGNPMPVDGFATLHRSAAAERDFPIRNWIGSQNRTRPGCSGSIGNGCRLQETAHETCPASFAEHRCDSHRRRSHAQLPHSTSGACMPRTVRSWQPTRSGLRCLADEDARASRCRLRCSMSGRIPGRDFSTPHGATACRATGTASPPFVWIRRVARCRYMGHSIEIRHRPVHLSLDANASHVLVAYNNPSSLSVHTSERRRHPWLEVEQPAPDRRRHLRASDPRASFEQDGRHGDAGKRTRRPSRAEDPGALKIYCTTTVSSTNRQSIAPNGGSDFSRVMSTSIRRSRSCP